MFFEDTNNLSRAMHAAGSLVLLTLPAELRRAKILRDANIGGNPGELIANGPPQTRSWIRVGGALNFAETSTRWAGLLNGDIWGVETGL